MTNLTEQWQKGNFDNGFYYIETDDIKSTIDYYSTSDYRFFTHPDERVMKVLAEVPSYELWKAVHEQWKVLLEENKRLKHDVGNLGYKIKNQRHEIDNLLKEIEKLKELLKRVNKHFKWVDDDDPFYVKDELWKDIKKVLGEE